MAFDAVKSGEDLVGLGNNSAKLNMSNYNNATIASINAPLFEHKDPKSTQSYSLGHSNATGAKDFAKMTTAEIIFDTTHNSLVNSMTWQSKSSISFINLLPNGPKDTAAVVKQQQNVVSTAPLFTLMGTKTPQEIKDSKNMSSFSKFANMTEEEIKNFPPSFDKKGRYSTTA